MRASLQPPSHSHSWIAAGQPAARRAGAAAAAAAARARGSRQRAPPPPAAQPQPAAAAAPPPAVNSPEAAGDQFDALNGLLGGAVHASVRLLPTSLGRGLVATQPLPAGTPVVSVDAFNTLAVTDEPARTGNAFGGATLADFQLLHGDLPPLLSNFLASGRADWFRRLVAWLLFLSHHGAGMWPLYIGLLPKENEMASLMNFKPEERRELQCPQLEALAQQERDGIRHLHDSMFSSTTGELAPLDLAPSFEHTLWAACMVNSRCFSDNVGREALSLMVPLADLANHDAVSPNAAYQLDAAAQMFRITTTVPVPAGGELLISYLGSKPTKSNTQLLKDYGFVLAGNVNDAVPFEPLPAGQQPSLNAAALVSAAAAAADAAAAAGASGEAVAALKRRQQAALKSLQPYVLLGSSSSGGGGAPPGTDRQLARKLAELCSGMLARHATSLEEDEVLLAGQQQQALSPRIAAAVVARLERKRLIAAARSVLVAYGTGQQQ